MRKCIHLHWISLCSPDRTAPAHIMHIRCLCLCLLCLALGACRSSKQLADTTAPLESATPFSPQAYLQRVETNQSEANCLTAKTKLKITMGEKTISSTGTLRMKRDDVIQLSVLDPILHVAEVGRMEFTQDRVLIIDRFNKQYIDVPYNEVAFLQRANVDFHTLQSLFWNELFVPGQPEVEVAAAYERFVFSSAEGGEPTNTGEVKIDFADALLDYSFYTQQPLGTLIRTDITGNRTRQSQFQFEYADFIKFDGKAFPAKMIMSFVMSKQSASLSISLSSLKDDDGWATRSNVPENYTKADAEKILRALVR